jgi:hypothetical protein
MAVGHLQVENAFSSQSLRSKQLAVGGRHLLVSSAGAVLVASTCSSPPALASSCWGLGGGGSGIVASSLGAGGSGTGVVETGSGSFNLKADAVLTKQN